MRPVLLLAAAVPCLARASPVTYSLEPGQTELVAITHPAGFLGGMAHSHLIAARDPAGTVVYDADAPERSRVEVRLSSAKLDDDDPALRKKYGLEGTLDEGDRRKVGETMRSGSQLDVAKHPDITFVSRSVRAKGDGSLEVSGVLAIHGVEAPVTLPVKVSTEGEVLRGEGQVHITHRMFGIHPYSTGMGAVRNADGIELRVTLVGRAGKAGGTASGDSP